MGSIVDVACVRVISSSISFWLAGDSRGGSEAIYQMPYNRPIGHTRRMGWKAVTRLSPKNA